MLALHRVPRPQLHPRSQAHLASILSPENGGDSLFVDVQLANRSRVRQESSRRQSDHLQTRAFDSAAETVKHSTVANLAILRFLPGCRRNNSFTT